MGWFHSDEDAEARATNPYHPFLSRGEWELAEFLSCSGLSMKLIDNFFIAEFGECGSERPDIMLN